MTEQKKQDKAPAAPAKEAAPSKEAALAAQIVEAFKADPTLAGIVLKDAIGDPVVRKHMGIAGAPRRRKRQPGNSEGRQFVAIYGDATHDEDFVPVPPEHVVARGEAAVRMWQDKWRDGEQPGATQFADEELGLRAHM